MRLRTAAEAAIGFGLEVGGQIAGFAKRHVHALVEVLAGLPITRNDLVGDDVFQERPQLVPEGPVVGGQFDP